MPSDRVLDVSRATDYQVTPHELRRDLYPHPDDGLPTELRAFGVFEEFSEVLTEEERAQLAAAIAAKRPDEAIRLIECLDVQVNVRGKLLEAAQRLAPPKEGRAA